MSVSSAPARSSFPTAVRSSCRQSNGSVRMTGTYQPEHTYHTPLRTGRHHSRSNVNSSNQCCEQNDIQKKTFCSRVASQTCWTVYVGSTCGHHGRVPESALLKMLRVPVMLTNADYTDSLLNIETQLQTDWPNVLLMPWREVPHNGLWKLMANYWEKYQNNNNKKYHTY